MRKRNVVGLEVHNIQNVGMGEGGQKDPATSATTSDTKNSG